VPAARRIGTLVNTHANGDHCYGNSLVRGAAILASKACAEEMAEVPPAVLAAFVEAAPGLGRAGEFLLRAFGAFEFRGIEPAPPTETFEGELERRVGGKRVRLIEVGPAHTKGDVLVHSLDDRVVFTGDILFIDGTPIMWEGPVAGWIRACERIEAMDVDVVVPGHGPITDRSGARRVREYLVYVRDEARRRFDAGMSAADAARDVALGDFSAWGDAERIVVNVDTLYREFSGSSEEVLATAMKTLIRHVGTRARTAPIQDHLKGRKSEMEFINGLVARKGKETGVPTPYNDAVAELARRIDAGSLRMDPSNFDLLRAMVAAG